MVTAFPRLLDSARNSKRRLSSSLKVRPNDVLIVRAAGIGIVLRPAFPNCPASGSENAARLKNPSGLRMGKPVLLARALPMDPLPPASERLPNVRAVSQWPEVYLTVPCNTQPRINVPARPDGINEP